jgi:hypothetical protein
VGAPVVSGVDAAPIFEPAEHVFDLVALFVEDGVIGDCDFLGLIIVGASVVSG